MNYILQSTAGAPIKTVEKEKEKKLEQGLTNINFEQEENDEYENAEELKVFREKVEEPKVTHESGDLTGRSSEKPAAVTKFFDETAPVDKYHVTIRATSKTHGDFQVRIRSFSSRSYQYMRNAKEEYDRIAYYYSCVNRYYTQKCPSFYQYR